MQEDFIETYETVVLFYMSYLYKLLKREYYFVYNLERV